MTTSFLGIDGFTFSTGHRSIDPIASTPSRDIWRRRAADPGRAALRGASHCAVTLSLSTSARRPDGAEVGAGPSVRSRLSSLMPSTTRSRLTSVSAPRVGPGGPGRGAHAHLIIYMVMRVARGAVWLHTPIPTRMYSVVSRRVRRLIHGTRPCPAAAGDRLSTADWVAAAAPPRGRRVRR